jgi:2,3-bisphosphoglycerate-independent phosphoglycerate mutase
MKQAALIILDGWGYREDAKDNAVAVAKKPNFDRLWREYPHALLEASGGYVGLPDGQMGNSEIGHTTIGAGSVIDTDLVQIAKAIRTGNFEKNFAFISLFDHVKKHDSTLHVMGLLGNGGVHAHQDHLVAFLRAAKNAGIKKVSIHAFTDGRDTAPQSAAGFLEMLEDNMKKIGVGFIASVTGRYFAMDRDKNWDRVKRAEDAIFECKGNVCKVLPSKYLQALYKDGKLDEHLEPIICTDDKGLGSKIEDNDALLFFNFRSDRARELSERVLSGIRKNVLFATFTEYSKDYKCLVAFPPRTVETTLAKEISLAGLSQAHIAETEKFPHATYFLNGGVEKPYANEKHIMLASRKDVKTHDEAPEMRAEAIADKAVEEIKSGTNFIFINFANPDMVGHTANVPAIIKAIETTDRELGRVIDALEQAGGVAFITADHGNAEVNVDEETGEKHTAHTINPVPAILTAKDLALKNGGLSDIAPTILSLLDIKKPKGMTGKILVE